MRKNEVVVYGKKKYRILDCGTDDSYLVIDCDRRTMPKWIKLPEAECKPAEIESIDRSLSPNELKVVRMRFTMISSIIPIVGDEPLRSQQIAEVAEEYSIGKQTVRKYLCAFLATGDVKSLAPAKTAEKKLSSDEKNMRWALNKFFYTSAKNTLTTAYKLMLQKKYCDGTGKLKDEYPSFYQFRYFYRKTRSMQNFYISRLGMKKYQRDHRPLLGDGVQNFAGGIGIYMLDATVCDIYLVNGSGGIVGRPILTAAVDAYSELCVGYCLSWEGGIYSLRNLMLNIVTDKRDYSRKYGIEIDGGVWDCKEMGGRLMTDMGREYASDTFAQLVELGISITNLPPYRPDLKSIVERFFQTIQDIFKPHLKGKGVIEPDFQERGAHDYRLDACLTMDDFEKIVLRAIIYYNSKKVVDGFIYTDDMIQNGVRPYSNSIWNYGKTMDGANLLEVTAEEVIMALLPRTTGQFARDGLRVNKMRYGNRDYTQSFLTGKKEAVVAYNPDDVSCVWLIESNGEYVRFDLIESRYCGLGVADVANAKKSQSEFVRGYEHESLEAEIDVARHIQAIVGNKQRDSKTLSGIRENRKEEERKAHKDILREAGLM